MKEKKYSTEDIKKILMGDFPENALEELVEYTSSIAGDHLMKRMTHLFGGEGDALKWFYSDNFTLSKDSPYQRCKDGKPESVEYVLDQIEYGGCA